MKVKPKSKSTQRVVLKKSKGKTKSLPKSKSKGAK